MGGATRRKNQEVVAVAEIDMEKDPTEQFEERVPTNRTMMEALRIEQLKQKLSSVRSSIAHVERSLSKDDMNEERLGKVLAVAQDAEEAMFRVRYECGYP